MISPIPEQHPYDGFAIDLDGVVWLSREPIDGSPEAIVRLREAGMPVVFVSNDPRSTRTELAERLTEIGAPTDATQVLTSASASAQALARERPGATVMVVGTESLRRELEEAGLRAVGTADVDTGATVVLVGGGAPFDREVLHQASATARDGAEIWATNKDPTYPTPDGLVPGTGAIVAALEVASGVEARNIGKPEPELFLEATELLGCERALMAGDSLGSDIAGAARAGMATALILTGKDAREGIAAAAVAPDHVFSDLAELALQLG